jgi:hypothetical protein
MKDPRHPSTRRHLRKLYADPMTGKATWGLVQAGGGSGIAGVHSLSDEKPTAKGHAGGDLAGRDYRQSYRDWKFMGAP